MTSKEIDKILKSPVTQSAKGSFITIEQLEQIKNKLKESEKQSEPTLSECIKEWEDRGMEVKILNDENVINIFNPEVYSVISINLENKLYIKTDSVIYSCVESITFDEQNLISKTIKALEAINND